MLQLELERHKYQRGNPKTTTIINFIITSFFHQ